MFKKVLFSLGVFVFVFIAGAGIAYAANPDEGQPWSRLWKVVVTNWPENQKVTITNPSPIPVSGNFSLTGDVSVNNLPANQNVTITNSSPISVTNGLLHYEYSFASGITDLTAFFNEKGSQGWEYDGMYGTYAVFKRIVP